MKWPSSAELEREAERDAMPVVTAQEDWEPSDAELAAHGLVRREPSGWTEKLPWLLLAGGLGLALWLFLRPRTSGATEEADEDVEDYQAMLPPAPPSMDDGLADAYERAVYSYDTRGQAVVARALEAEGYPVLAQGLLELRDWIDSLSTEDYADYVLEQLDHVHGPDEAAKLAPVRAQRADETLIVYPRTEQYEVERG